MKLLRVALPVPLYRAFDYRASAGTDDDCGRIVRVGFARRRLLGVVVDEPTTSAVPDAELVDIDGFADDLPRVPADVVELSRFASDYYQCPLGMTLQHAVPPRGRLRVATSARAPHAYRLTADGTAAVAGLKARAHRQRALAELLRDGVAVERERLLEAAGHPTLRRWLQSGWLAPADPPAIDVRPPVTLCLPELNAAQHSAKQRIEQASGFETLLLHGVTGSGKTEVYLAAAAAALAQGGQVLMLVPEINLTPQLADRVARALPDCSIVQLHSHLSPGERVAAWRQAAAGRAQFILGTRLAVFAPLPRLALIVVDEENDLSYKQQDGLRYNARDLAIYRGQLRNVPVVLGSATPSLETAWRARAGRYVPLHLPARAVAGSPPAIRLVRQRGDGEIGGLTTPLLDAIGERLNRSEQSLVFVNRRGYSPSLLCVACGWAAQCERCSARLVVHLSERRLRCHHCGFERRLDSSCPICGAQDLLPLGFGTQRLEAALRDAFPSARVARIDADSTRRKGTWRQLLGAILAGDLDILIGTQMMVKGHDFPRLTLVGILGADNALYSADFRATERLYAQLTQVAGRAGRATLTGEVLIQTDFPTHAVYRALQAGDQEAHFDVLLAERRQLGLPPFARLALLRAEARERAVAEHFLDAASAHGAVLARGMDGVRVNAPVPARLARRAGFERAHVLVQSPTARQLQAFLPGWREWVVDHAPRAVRWSIDVDPQDVD